MKAKPTPFPIPRAALFYTIAAEYDGRTYQVELLPEQQARDWLWRIVSRPQSMTSRVILRRVEVTLYDEVERTFGWPGDVNPLTGKPLSTWMVES